MDASALAELLRAAGHTADIARSTSDGLHAAADARRAGKEPALIVFDARELPGRLSNSGISTITGLLALLPRARALAILPYAGLHAAALDAGATVAIWSPLRVGEVAARVEEVLRTRAPYEVGYRIVKAIQDSSRRVAAAIDSDDHPVVGDEDAVTLRGTLAAPEPA
jgi:DNA-binding response OmpR family regulator